MMNRYAELLRYQPEHSYVSGVESYGYTERGDDWESHVSCTREGLDQLIVHARITEHWAEHLAAASEWIGERCIEHGMSTESMRWDINDYICEPERDPSHIDWLFDGLHEEGDWPFCIPAWAHSVPAGLIVGLG